MNFNNNVTLPKLTESKNVRNVFTKIAGKNSSSKKEDEGLLSN